MSTGGFSREARHEADWAKLPLILMDLDGLGTALMEYYDHADSETRALVPMTHRLLAHVGGAAKAGIPSHLVQELR